MSSNPQASFSVSSSQNSWFGNESVGDVIIHPSDSTQKMLIGVTQSRNAMLVVASNAATVAGTLNAVNLNTNLIQSTGIHLSLYDPTQSNMMEVIGPQYAYLGTDAATSNAAFSASNVVNRLATFSGGSNAVPAITAFGETVLVTNRSSNAIGLSVNGNIRATGDIAAYSDRSLKADLVVIPEALAKVQALSGYTFRRVDEAAANAGRRMGLIAQDVQGVAPEAVSLGEDGLYTVAYGNLVALLVEAVKELTHLTLGSNAPSPSPK